MEGGGVGWGARLEDCRLDMLVMEDMDVMEGREGGGIEAGKGLAKALCASWKRSGRCLDRWGIWMR